MCKQVSPSRRAELVNSNNKVTISPRSHTKMQKPIKELRDSMESNCNEDSETPSPNLMPRHKELVPTPCGPVKNDSKDPTQEDFTISVIQLIGIAFCFYYVLHGTFQENRQELIAFVLSILFVVIRSMVNFVTATPVERNELKIRFGFILVFGVFLMVLSIIYLIKSPSMMAFRVSGAFESAQSQYFMVFFCFSMVTFDLQAQLCLCVLVLTSGASHVSLGHSVILGVGICWAIIKAVVGLIAILKENKYLVWIFMIQNLPELAYLGYLLYLVITEWGLNGTYVLEAGAVTGATFSVAIKAVLGWSMIKVSCCFGQGLHERMFNRTEPLP
ncbi:uncharacterized protein LOC109912939 isoform X2 [Rhincodon typus]|uniref:uncharacterized protein LOC109912939 isoform X2 n=2 Tax=Rhincodon typus TaxID=259920 RepID=UPI00202F7248|nr:uncharacterized protein LOC109912939 isoform X2 [Rhincodon typus]